MCCVYVHCGKLTHNFRFPLRPDEKRFSRQHHNGQCLAMFLRLAAFLSVFLRIFAELFSVVR